MASGVATSESDIGAFFHEHALGTDELQYYSIFVADPSEDLSVTVAWYDPPSTVASYNVSCFLQSVDWSVIWVLVVVKFLYFLLWYRVSVGLHDYHIMDAFFCCSDIVNMKM